jgi:hypothetical protein
MCVGSVITLSDVTTGGTWSSSGVFAGVGSVSGVVSGISAGTETISYTAGGCSVSTVVTVNPIPPAIGGSDNACVGATTALSDATTGGAWSSSNPIIASVGSTTGVVTGNVVGSVTITYSLGPGCTVTMGMTVDPLPASITGGTSICVGATTTLADGSTGGVWSSATGLATVGSSTGIVTGVSGGTAIISYTIPTGCAATYAVSVIAVPAITGISNLCAWGDTMTVYDTNPAGTYSSILVTVLNLGGGVGKVTSNAPGTASITYTLSSSCALTTTLTVNPLPGPISGITNLCTGSTSTLSDTAAGGIWSSGGTGIATIGSATGLLTGITGGTTHISYTIPTGCVIDTVVTITNFPTAGTISGATTVCTGQTITESAVGSGVWSITGTSATVSAGVVTGVSAGIDTIKYTVTNLCGTAQAVKTITVNQTPSAGVITGIDSVCTDNVVLLNDTAAGGVWSCSNILATVSAAGVVTGAAAGIDTVFYTVSVGSCTAKADMEIKVLPFSQCGALHINSGLTSPYTNIQVFPNPNEGTFTITGYWGPISNEEVSLEITDLLGKVIYRDSVTTKSGKLHEQIRLSTALADGMYLLNLQSASEHKVFHIVIGK